jgi:iron complex transport system ATP-binding protein
VELALQLADTVWLMTREQGVTIGSPQQLAREGVLAKFIEREGITFNPETLAITVRKGN